MSVDVTAFGRNFDDYVRQAERGAIEVTEDGQVRGYFLSARSYEAYRRIEELAAQDDAGSPKQTADGSCQSEPPAGRKDG